MVGALFEAEPQSGATGLGRHRETALARAEPAASVERTIRLLGVLLIGAALLPTALTPLPAMVDYLNHVARMDILSRMGAPNAHPYYQIEWALYPNLATDLIVPPIAKLIGPIAATRLFFLVSQILILVGAAAIERAVKGRILYSPIVACLFLYAMPFAFGFLNFQFGLGFALLGIAAMLAWDERPALSRLAIHSVFCAFLFVSHFYAFGVYGAALGLNELSKVRFRPSDLKRAAGRLFLLAVPALFLFAMLSVGGGTVGADGTAWLIHMKPLVFFHILSGYYFAFSATCVIILISGGVVLAKSQALEISRAGVVIAIGFGCIFLFMPSKFLGTAYADIRILPALALILPAFASIRPERVRCRLAAAWVMSAAALANIAVVLWVWTSYTPEYRRMIESFALVESGSRVLIGHSGGLSALKDLTLYPLFHAPTLAVHYANAFVPNVFTEPEKQPIRVRADLREIDTGYLGPAPTTLLRQIADGDAPESTPRFIQNWPREFDYLYVVGRLGPNNMPDRLQELGRGRHFVLYRIRKEQPLAQ